MSLQERIYVILKENCYKQSAIAEACGYDAKKFNAMLRGRKSITTDDIVPICTALKITPNELFNFD